MSAYGWCYICKKCGKLAELEYKASTGVCIPTCPQCGELEECWVMRVKDGGEHG